MTKPSTIQYWDSCCFISLLTGKDPKRLDTLKELIRELEERKTTKIVISSFVIAEVRPAPENTSLIKEEYEKAVELLTSDKIEQLPLTETIALRAQSIGKDFPKLLPGDCVHIATAIVAQADVLFTFDGSDEGGKRRRRRQMIDHSGKIGNPPLKICEPYVPSGPLFDSAQANREAEETSREEDQSEVVESSEQPQDTQSSEVTEETKEGCENNNEKSKPSENDSLKTKNEEENKVDKPT